MKQLFTFIFTFLFINLFSQNFHLVKDLTPGTEDSELGAVYAFDGKALFIKEIDVDLFDFYITDGSENGTTKVNSEPISKAEDFNTLLETPEFIFLTIFDFNTNKAVIYRYEKSAQKFESFVELTLTRSITSMVMYKSNIYFGSTDELYKLDPNTGDYDLIKTFPDDLISNIVVFNNKLNFMAGSEQGYGLYESDGTSEGTDFITVLTDNVNESVGLKSNIAIANEALYMNVTYSFSGKNSLIYSSDGSAVGTKLIATLTNFSSEVDFYSFEEKVIFVGSKVSPDPYSTLFVTDGTPENTKIIDESLVLDFYSSPILFKDKLFFSNNNFLLSTDGVSITQPLPDTIFFPIGVFNDSLYILDKNIRIAVTDGNSIGSVKPFALTNLFGFTNNKFYFGATDAVYGSEMWVAEIGSISTKPIEKLIEISCWPNPASNKINFNSEENLDLAEVSIYSSFGSLVVTGKTNKNSFDISELLPGNYYVRISKQHKRYSGKLVKI